MRSVHIVGCGNVLRTRLVAALREHAPSTDVFVVDSSTEALRRFGAEPRSSIVLAPIRTGDGGGLDLVRNLRAAGCRARIVLLTTSSQSSYRRLGREAGADACVDVARGIPAILRAARAT